MKRDEITIDDEFREQLPPLTQDELATLHENIIADGGFNYPVVVWQEESLCVDGHNRLAIYDELVAQGHQLRFPTPRMMNFRDRAEAKRWIDQNARGTRNLMAKYKEILIGREYERRKMHERGGGDRKSIEVISTDHIDSERTADTMAEEHGIGPATVRRYAAKAKVFDAVVEEFGTHSDEARLAIEAPMTVVQTIVKAKNLSGKKAVDEIKKAQEKKAAPTAKQTAEESLPVCDINGKPKANAKRSEWIKWIAQSIKENAAMPRGYKNKVTGKAREVFCSRTHISLGDYKNLVQAVYKGGHQFVGWTDEAKPQLPAKAIRSAYEAKCRGEPSDVYEGIIQTARARLFNKTTAKSSVDNILTLMGEIQIFSCEIRKTGNLKTMKGAQPATKTKIMKALESAKMDFEKTYKLVEERCR